MGHGIPITYVPARNTVLLSLCLGYAEWSGHLTCSSGQCRRLLRLPRLSSGVFGRVRAARESGDQSGRRRAGDVPRPRAALAATKAEIIRLGTTLGVDYAQTLSCYDPDDAGKPSLNLRFGKPLRQHAMSPSGRTACPRRRDRSNSTSARSTPSVVPNRMISALVSRKSGAWTRYVPCPSTAALVARIREPLELGQILRTTIGVAGVIDVHWPDEQVKCPTTSRTQDRG